MFMEAERVMLISVWDSLNFYRMKLANLSKTYGFEDVQGDCLDAFYGCACMMISMRNEPPDFLGTTASGLCSCAAHYFNIYIHLEGEITCIVFVFIDRLFFG